MEFELEIIRWLQSFQNGFLDGLFQFFTMFGEELVIIGAMGFLYWCYDKKIGEYVGVTAFVSLYLNSAIKTIVMRPRPFVADPEGIVDIRPATATGYSFPSGHTQGAATVFAGLAVWLRKRWLTIAATVIIVLVAISRMYLGAHYLSDVVVGGLLGVGLAAGFHYLFVRYPQSIRALYRWIAIASAAIAIVIFVWRFFTVGAEAEMSDAANLYDKMEGTFKMIGAMVGFLVGIRFEESKVRFVNHRVLWKNLVRFVLGVGVVMGVRYGLKAVFGILVDGESLVAGEKLLVIPAVLLDGLRYFAMVFVGIGLYPALFARVRL
jgi:membrane-associated phospholipid phosphatase